MRAKLNRVAIILSGVKLKPQLSSSSSGGVGMGGRQRSAGQALGRQCSTLCNQAPEMCARIAHSLFAFVVLYMLDKSHTILLEKHCSC